MCLVRYLFGNEMIVLLFFPSFAHEGTRRRHLLVPLPPPPTTAPNSSRRQLQSGVLPPLFSPSSWIFEWRIQKCATSTLLLPLRKTGPAGGAITVVNVSSVHPAGMNAQPGTVRRWKNPSLVRSSLPYPLERSARTVRFAA